MKSFEYKGLWWIPANPEDKVTGFLKFNPSDGIKLELIGSFKSSEEAPKRVKYPIILGLSTDGKLVTLYKCYESGTTLSFPGMMVSSFRAKFAIVGAHFENEDDIKFTEVFIRYRGIESWVAESGFNITYYFDKGGKVNEISVTYRFPEPITLMSNDSYTISVRSGGRMPLYPEKDLKVHMQEKKYIHIKFNETADLKKCLQLVAHIQDFISFCIYTIAYPQEIKAKVKNHNGGRGKVEIYYRIPYRAIEAEVSEKKPIIKEVLLTLEDIKGKVDTVFSKWMSKLSIIRPICSRYFSELYNPTLYIEDEFLDLLHAIEFYHRGTCQGKYISDGDYEAIFEEIVKSLPKCVPPQLHDKIREMLRYANEYSLRQRLKDLFRKYRTTLKEMVKELSNRKNVLNLIDKIVNTRNFLIHGDRKLEAKALSGEDIYRAAQKLRVLIEIFLLDEIGLTQNEIAKCLERKYQFRKHYLFK